ncbi:sensor histidine kinase [Kineococcus rhizosphaerae]|nr:HAMP domain-containing sensor histidine kinase [Kineococcus rhizosphaerae]
MFTIGAAVLAVVGALSTYAIARGYLLSQRENSATRQTFADASFVQEGLRTSGVQVSDVLGSVSSPAGSAVLVHREGQWYSSSLDVAADGLPATVTDGVQAGDAGLAWTTIAGDAVLVVGVPLPAVDAGFFEVVRTDELSRTLSTLRFALTGCAVLIASGGAALGSWTSRRAVAPLHAVARAAASIAGGQTGTRLETTEDPDLATIVGSFNSMVDALEEEIERQSRFSADVSHELRSPLTTLVTGVEVLNRRRAELPERSRRALDLVSRELDRFTRTVDDLLELGRLEAGVADHERVLVDAVDLVRQVLSRTHRESTLFVAPAEPVLVIVDKEQVARALVNLLENADRHGGGSTGVGLQVRGASAVITVDDDGPGVPPQERERIFERFARAGSRRALPGSGLGLSLVAETVRGHGGSVRCTCSPSGGARFLLRLPLPDDGVRA